MSSCTKVSYQTERHAKSALRAIRSKSAPADRKKPTGVYWCGHCRTWHLTSKSGDRPPPWKSRRSGRDM